MRGRLPIFRSHRQQQLLVLTLLQPAREYTLAELAGLLESPLSSLHREVEALVDADVLRSRRIGRVRLVSANMESPLARPLAEILSTTQGPITVVAEEFADIPGTELVLIFGSWAARHNGRPGRPPADIDVLVVGSPNRDHVYDSAERAEARLRMPVDPVVVSRQRWDEGSGLLVREVQASDRMLVIDRRGEAA
jgi:predicted nucleotidyltransferase